MTHVIYYEQNLMSCHKKNIFDYNFKESEKFLTQVSAFTHKKFTEDTEIPNRTLTHIHSQ